MQFRPEAQLSEQSRQGHLLIIGGSEDRHNGMQVLERFLDLAGGADKNIVVITAASEIPAEVWEMYREAFTGLGVAHLAHVHLDSPKEADSEKVLAPIRDAAGIFMTGGAQTRLLDMIGDTPLHAAIRTAYRENGACIAGTSAGASAMSHLMVAGGKADIEPEKGAIKLETGLGLVRHIIVDQHFAQRQRLPRLLSVVAEHQDLYGIGIDEDTGLVICPGVGIDVVGAGSVTVVDGTGMTSNIAEIDKHAVPRLIGVTLHLLPTGTKLRAEPAADADTDERVPEQLQDFFSALIERDQ